MLHSASGQDTTTIHTAIQHGLAAISVGLFTAHFLAPLQILSLILSSVAAAGSIVTMIWNTYQSWKKGKK